MLRRSASSRASLLKKKTSPAATPPPSPEFQVRVQGPDGKFAEIPIWVPLSIMAASAARTAGANESIAQAVSEAVISHGNVIAQKRSRAGPSVSVDVMGEITLASRRASHVFMMAGGSQQAAHSVEEAMQGGGRLLVPSLNSNQAIKLDRSESRHDVETNQRRGRESLRTAPGNNKDEERGVHHVGSASKLFPVFPDDVSDNPSKQVVSWVEETVTLGNDGNTYTGHMKGGSLKPLSGREIVLDNSKRSDESSSIVQRQQKPQSRSHPARQSGSNSSGTGESTSEYGYEDNGCCAEMGEGLVSEDDARTFGSANYDNRGLLLVGAKIAAEELQGLTFKPVNLLPQWEARSVSDTITCVTQQTGVHSTMAPFMNLFLPVPKTVVDEEEVKTKSRFDQGEQGDDTNVMEQQCLGESLEKNVRSGIWGGMKLDPSYASSSRSNGTYDGTLQAEDMSASSAGNSTGSNDAMTVGKGGNNGTKMDQTLSGSMSMTSKMSRLDRSQRSCTSSYVEKRMINCDPMWGEAMATNPGQDLDPILMSRNGSIGSSTASKVGNPKNDPTIALDKSKTRPHFVHDPGSSSKSVVSGNSGLVSMDSSAFAESKQETNYNENNDIIIGDDDSQVASYFDPGSVRYGVASASHASSAASYSTTSTSGHHTMTTQAILSMNGHKDGCCASPPNWRCLAGMLFDDNTVESGINTEKQSMVLIPMQAVTEESCEPIEMPLSAFPFEALPESDPKKKSPMKKMQAAFGRLNCGSKKKKRERNRN